MRHKTLRFGRGFNVVLGNRRSQAAQMVLEPGDSEGNRENRHDGADQWLFVVAGTGVAHVNERRVLLRAGSLLLIEHGDRHEIRNNGRGRLTTLNFYVPPRIRGKETSLPRASPPRRRSRAGAKARLRKDLPDRRAHHPGHVRRIFPTLGRATAGLRAVRIQ